jgi:2-C-methyl-D-erythritol 4-phosphate cytidylyltransferase
VVPAAGVGVRMLADRPKQYLLLAGKTVLEQTLSRLLKHPKVVGIVLVLGVDDLYWTESYLASDPRILIARGGAQRSHSVLNGLNRLAQIISTQEWVMVHDAARPCISHEDLDSLILATANTKDGLVLGAPVRDTMKQADDSARILATLDRNTLWHAFTPQIFRLGELVKALTTCIDKNLPVTDEASAMEHCGYHPQMLQGSEQNIKITRPMDLILAELILKTEAKEH